MERRNLNSPSRAEPERRISDVFLSASLVAALLAAGCDPETGSGDPDAGPKADAGPLGPFSELPFPDADADDFALDEEVGIALATQRVLVAFEPGASLVDAERAIRTAGATLAGALGEAKIALVLLPPGLSSAERQARVEALEADPAVAFAGLDSLILPDVVPADSMDTPSWRWGAIDGNWGLRAMGMPVAWNLHDFIAAEAEARRVRVGVIDVFLQRHPDLDPHFSVRNNAYADSNPSRYHGTAVAGIIGARWNGQFTDGVSPFVSIYGANLPPSGGTGETYPASFATAIASAWGLLAETSFRPRLINMSLGYNWSSSCLGGRRCDPRIGTTLYGPAAPDARCNGAVVRSAMAQAGGVFSQLVTAAQSRAPVFFIVSAGNDSGPNVTTGNYCASPSTQFSDLGAFPADLNSPMTWAAKTNPNILVVEVVQRTSDLRRDDVATASYGNINGHILAPGEVVRSLAGGGSQAATTPFRGTSAATPYVTGAAAWLLALNPTLSNDELRRLLLVHDGSAIAPTSTTKRLFVPESIAAMQVQLVGSPVRFASGAKVLADIDDGTVDGFTRIQNGVPYVGRRDYGRTPPKVDLADVRHFRDTRAFLNREGPPCRPEVYACDLNGNGAVTPGEERYPRAALTLDGLSLDRLAEQWDGDSRQAYQREDLANLLASADVWVHGSGLLGRYPGLQVSATLSGRAPAGVTAPNRPTALTDLPIAGSEIFTTALTEAASVTVKLGAPFNRTFTKTLGNLSVAEDVDVHLNPCALEPGSMVDFFSPPSPDCMPEMPDAGVADAGPVDAGSVDAGPNPMQQDCASLRASDLLYFCLEMSGGGAPTRSIAYKRVRDEVMRAYYSSGQSRTFIRMSGAFEADGIQQVLTIDTMTLGNGPIATPWPVDYPVPFAIFFGDADLTTGVGKTGDFEPIAGDTPSGTTTVTRYDAVGGVVEGTFSGTGNYDARWPTEGRFEPVSVTGSFRVRRTPDS